VVIVGNGPSAHDILREISSVAKEVHQALRASDVHFKKFENHNNIWQHSVVLCFFYQKNAISFEFRSFKIDKLHF